MRSQKPETVIERVWTLATLVVIVLTVAFAATRWTELYINPIAPPAAAYIDPVDDG